MPSTTFTGTVTPPATTPSPSTPNYGKQIDRWKNKIGDLGKGHQKKKSNLRDKIQGAKVERWSDKTNAAANAPTPKDSTYNSDIAGANLEYGNAMIGAGLKTAGVNRNYGFDAEYQQGGAQYNPYSRASELTAAWQRDQRTTLNSYAAGGQLYSGARENAVAHDNRAYLSDYNTARSQQQDEIAAIEAEKITAQEEKNAAVDAAEKANMDRALAEVPTEAPPPPKFIKQEKKDLKSKLEKLTDRRGDAKNKAARKKIKRSIKKTKKELSSIPQQYAE